MTAFCRAMSCACLLAVSTIAWAAPHEAWAPTPPMGWNSWDCYGAGVSEAEVLANADYMADKLKSHGWDVVTIDIQWYEPQAHATEYRAGAILETDANGRLLPAANRFPMTAATRSFKPIADYLHGKGLRLGVHLLRGIPRQCVDRDNAPILGTNVRAADIADKASVCRWNGDMYGVDMNKPGAQAYYDSVFALLAAWEIDFVKVDDLSGHAAEIEAIRRAIDKAGRKIVFSISPGGASNELVKANANLWRISGDLWDNWPSLFAQFERLDRATPFRGPGHWPDADMIPFGAITNWPESRRKWTQFTRDEQYTLMSLWCIARSPLIFGGHLPANDDFTLSLLTNDEVIAVDQRSTNNRQLSRDGNHVVWVADVEGSGDKYVALFNADPPPPPRPRRDLSATQPGATTAPQMASEVPATAPATRPNPAATRPAVVSVKLSDLGLDGPVKVRDLWKRADVGSEDDEISVTLPPHGAALYRVSQQ